MRATFPDNLAVKRQYEKGNNYDAPSEANFSNLLTFHLCPTHAACRQTPSIRILPLKKEKNYLANTCFVVYFITLQITQLLQRQIVGLFMDADLEIF